MNKNKPILYGVGIGPGDPELVTLKALKILKTENNIFAPKAKIKKQSLAFNIIKSFIQDDLNKTVRELEFPMTRDVQERESKWQKAASMINTCFLKRENAVFITLGDPSIYSTFVYLQDAIKNINRNVQIVTVPGINSFSLAAALANIPLAFDSGDCLIYPVLPETLTDLKNVLVRHDTIVLMKIGKLLPDVLYLLKEMQLMQNGLFIKNAGLPDQYIENELEKLDMNDKTLGYFSLIILRNKK